MKCTSVFSKNLQAYTDKRAYIINQGSSSSSKTYSVLQLLKIIGDRLPVKISVMSESMPHLKLGCINDFLNILKADNDYDERRHNKTEQSYQLAKGVIEFFSAEDSGKVHGPRRDILYINECNNVHYEVFYQASMRTNICTFLDFNPVQSFWVHDKLLPMCNDSEVAFIKSTYRDNQFLSEKIVRDIERRAAVDENYRRVYADGEIGSLEGLIYKSFTLVDAMPDTSRRVVGIDFGFTNDPTAIVDVRFYQGEWWLDELEYKSDMFAKNIAQVLNDNSVGGSINVVCDSADPRMIAELYQQRFNAKPCVKGVGSIVNGISLIGQYPINVTKRSTNLQKELRNYQWKKDKNGVYLNEPIGAWDHANDAWRYAAMDILSGGERSGSKIVGSSRR